MEIVITYPDKPVKYELGASLHAVHSYFAYKAYLQERVHRRVLPVFQHLYELAYFEPSQRHNVFLATIALSELRLSVETDIYRRCYLLGAVGGVASMLGLQLPSVWALRRSEASERLRQVEFDPQAAQAAGLIAVKVKK